MTTDPTPPLVLLAALGLSADLVRAAADRGWCGATPIQALAIPAVLQGRDLLALAPTGTGKSAAFLLPVLQRLLAGPAATRDRPRRLAALVLAPTRELAQQTATLAHALAPALKTVLTVGGVSVNPQMMALRGGADLVVATPGRVLDLLDQHALTLSGLRVLVLDEADRLLDLGFADEIGRVLALLPARRQTLLFSATMPEALERLAAGVMRDPLRLDVRAGAGEQAAAAPGAAVDPAADEATNGNASLPSILQRAIVVDTARRTPLLRQLIAGEGWSRVLVFVATQYASEHVADKLRRAGLAAAPLHGQLSAGRRRQALADFEAGSLTALVATDLAARGIDIARLDVVVNHDLPRSAADYTHRIGRTGRAGRSGQALSFICADAPGSEAHFRLIEKRQHQRVPREQIAGFQPVAMAPADAADPAGGIKGKRKSKKDKLREQAATRAG